MRFATWIGSVLLAVCSCAAIQRTVTFECAMQCAAHIEAELRTRFPTALEHTNVYTYFARRMTRIAVQGGLVDAASCRLIDSSDGMLHALINRVILPAFTEYVSFPGEHDIMMAMLAASLTRSAVVDKRASDKVANAMQSPRVVVLPHIFEHVATLVERLNIGADVRWDDAWAVTEAAIVEATVDNRNFAAFWSVWSQLKNATLVRPQTLQRAILANRRDIAAILQRYL